VAQKKDHCSRSVKNVTTVLQGSAATHLDGVTIRLSTCMLQVYFHTRRYTNSENSLQNMPPFGEVTGKGRVALFGLMMPNNNPVFCATLKIKSQVAVLKF